MSHEYEAELLRIGEALDAAAQVLADFTPGEVEHRVKSGDDPVTAADLAVNDVLARRLPRDGEGWLSEETRDDAQRLECDRVWVVDPLDGTREFVAGIPEWCVSIALVVLGRPLLGGIFNPVTGQRIVGGPRVGVTLNGEPCRTRPLTGLDGTEVLASRSEVRRGEWERFSNAPFRVRPMGSVAYKLGLVAAGLADATWTLVPKHEWDVAAGTALVCAAGGAVWTPDGGEPRFNRREPKFPGLLAAPSGLVEPIREFLGQPRS
jgi:myo-inositol-1(or 4)-monophosphatase